MQIQLNDVDLQKMPDSLRSELLSWLQYKDLKPVMNLNQQIPTCSENPPKQLSLAVEIPTKVDRASTIFNQHKHDHSHVSLTQLFDAGITKPKMPVRVKLLRAMEKQVGHCYTTTGLTISPKGTFLYKDEEFNKPSPLAYRVIGVTVNGWEYVEVQKNGNWICLDELRKIWRSVS
jgi:hypothetical protein